MRKKLQLLLFILGLISNVYSQTLELPKNIQSPNAASLGKYGDIPMDLSTGRANVNIPLYSLHEGGIPLDVSLSYDTGGVRVNDVAGWVGQNWTLNAGGVITRSVRGTAFDECTVETNNISVMQKGYYYYTNKLNVSNWNTKSYMSDLVRRSKSEVPGDLVLDEINADYEPDLFTFNFMGMTGKFFLGEDGEWKVSSKDNIKVIINMNDNVRPNNITSAGNNNNQYVFPKTIGKITLLDDQGNRFVFGGTQTAIEYALSDFFNQSSNKIIANAWYLKEVYNKYNKLIYNFTYERGDYVASFYDTNSWINFRKTFDGGIFHSGIGCDYTYGKTNQIFAGGQLIIPSYLTKITASNALTNQLISIDFSSETSNALKYGANDLPIIDTYQAILDSYINGGYGPVWASIDDGLFYFIRRDQNGNVLSTVQGGNLHIYPYLEALKWRKLTNVRVSNSNQTLRNVAFSYTDNPSYRLKLNSLNIDKEQKYTFEYNNFENLPIYTSKNIDHFGYYKSTPFVVDYNNPQNHESTRQTDINTVNYGTLSKIIYPTGGYTTFLYEPHQYSKYVGNDITLHSGSGTIGGVRISETRDYSDTNNYVSRRYSYVTDLQSQTSSGILLQKNNYFIQDYLIPTINNIPYYETHFNINSIIYLSNLMGPQLQYSSVIENNNNGYVVNKYNSFEDYPDSNSDTNMGNSLNVLTPHTEYGYKRGGLKLKQYFNQQGIKQREEIYSYSEIQQRKIRSFTYKYFVPCQTSSPSLYEPVYAGTAYNMLFSDFNLASKTIRTYNQNGDFVEDYKTSNYIDRESFGDNFLRDTNKNTTSYGTLTEEYQYTFDKNGTDPYTSLTNRREFSVVNTDKTKGFTKISSNKLEYASLPIYDNTATATSNTQIFPQKFYEAKGDNALKEKLTIDKYDADGNILQAHGQDGIYTFYFYAYNNRYPIIKIEGPLNIPAGATPFSSQASALRTLIEDPNSTISQIVNKQFLFVAGNYPEHQITCYTYKPDVGVTSIMNPNASIEFYNYDSTGRLMNIKDGNGKIIKDLSYELANQ